MSFFDDDKNIMLKIHSTYLLSLMNEASKSYYVFSFTSSITYVAIIFTGFETDRNNMRKTTSIRTKQSIKKCVNTKPLFQNFITEFSSL